MSVVLNHREVAGSIGFVVYYADTTHLPLNLIM